MHHPISFPHFVLSRTVSRFSAGGRLRGLEALQRLDEFAEDAWRFRRLFCAGVR
jgi:hypothetical protein